MKHDHAEPQAQALFAYGELLDPEIQRILFGAAIPMMPAALPGWELCLSREGRTLARPGRGQAAIEGAILELDINQLHRADQWEGIPFCHRRQARVVLPDGSEREPWIYALDGEAAPSTPNGQGKAGVAALRAKAGQQREQLERMQVPVCDMYIMVPCVIHPGRRAKLAEDDFVRTFNKTADIEYSGSLGRQFQRGVLDDVEIVACDGEEGIEAGERGRQRIRAYLSAHHETGLGIVILALPACTIAPQRLLGQMSGSDLWFAARQDPPPVPMKAWLASHGLSQMGTPRASVILGQEPTFGELCCLLSAEYDPVEGIVGHRIQEAARQNLAQYDYYQMYIAETCEVEFPGAFPRPYGERAADAILTLFVIELILFQDASLSRVQALVSREIEKSNSAPTDDALAVIEDLGSYFAKAMLFWDIRNFRYQTAQKCADDFARAFEIDRLRENYHANRNILEQLVQIHATRIAERDNRIINFVLITLAVLQVLPIIYEIISSTIYGNIHENQLLSAAGTAVTCMTIWAFFAWRRNRRWLPKAGKPASPLS